MTSAPHGCGEDCSPQARTACPESHPIRSGSRSLPMRREAQKVEGRAALRSAVARRFESEAACLLGVQAQAKFRKSLPEDIPHAPRVLLELEAEDEIVRVPHER